MDMTSVYAPIFKSTPQEDGSLLVYGKATDSSLDLDSQICDSEWLKEAVPRWFSVGNIRESHAHDRAVGKATELEAKDDGGHYVKARILDPLAKAKVEAGILSGFSIGIKNPRVVKDASAPGGRVVGGRIVELSLVDFPANEGCRLDLVKAVKPGVIAAPTDFDADKMLIKVEELHDDAALATPKDLAERLSKAASSISSAQDLAARLGKAADTATPDEDSPEPVVDPKPAQGITIPPVTTGTTAGNAEVVYTTTTTGTEELSKAIAEGLRRRGEKYPSVADLKKAIRIPAEWKPTLTKDAASGDWTHDPTSLRSVLSGLVDCVKAELDELTAGEDELWDLTQLLSIISGFCSWWSSEAAGGETQSPYTEDGSMAELAVTPDQTKAAEGEQAPETPEVNTEKVAAPEETKAAEAAPKTAEPSSEQDLTELVKSAVADAMKTSTTAAEEREAALAKELDSVKADLAKVLALPEPGGPVITRTAAQAAVARDNDTSYMKAEAQRLLKRADDAQDPTLRRGYKERAEAIMAKIA